MSTQVESAPMSLRERLEAILHRVERPARYIGGEWNQVVKDHAFTRIKMALCFPDVYGMEEIGSIRKKQNWLREKCDAAGIRFKWHHPEVSRLEGVFSLGDRGLGDVVEAAWRRGCSFDGWTERLDVNAWMEAFAECGIDSESYLTRDFGPGDALPWDHLDIGVTKKFLARELEKALAAHEDKTCAGDNCYGCAPFASACTGFLHGRRTGEVFFDGIGASGPVSAAVPGGGVRLPAHEPHTGAALSAPDPEPVEPPPPGGDGAAGVAVPEEREQPVGPVTYRYRASFTKTGPLRFLSQLDLVRLLARAFRRAGVPMAYSQGYHPMPKMAFGPALPVGIASAGELVDFETTRYLRRFEFLERINRFLPGGIRFTAVIGLGRGTVSLSQAINRVIYTAKIPAALQDGCRLAANGNGNGNGNGPGREEVHRQAVRDLLREPAIPYLRVRENRTKEIDLRPFLADLAVNGDAELRMELHMDNGRTAKPHEVLDVLYGEGSRDIPVTRQALLVVRGERRLSPLLVNGAGGTRDPRQL